MASEKLTKPQSLASYRRATAKRVGDMYEKEVDPETDETFVNGLVEVGLMERVV